LLSENFGAALLQVKSHCGEIVQLFELFLQREVKIKAIRFVCKQIRSEKVVQKLKQTKLSVCKLCNPILTDTAFFLMSLENREPFEAIMLLFLVLVLLLQAQIIKETLSLFF